MDEERKEQVIMPPAVEKAPVKTRIVQPLLWIVIVILSLCIVVMVGLMKLGTDSVLEKTGEPTTEKTAMVKVVGTEAMAVQTAREETETEIQKTEPAETKAAETETIRESADWKNSIFGEAKTGISTQISIAGLSSAEKEELGFKESDFVRRVSDFLNTERLEVKTITFTDKVSCSSEHAVAYLAELDNVTDQVLQVLLFPEYPGYYLLTLQEVQTLVIPVTQQTEAPVQPQTESVSVPQNTEASYDAMNLSILGIPETLLNYIDNRYELQYSLYRYLYSKGYTQMESATVTDYSIDSSVRKATIHFQLTDGTSVTGTYKKDDNSYSYK